MQAINHFVEHYVNPVIDHPHYPLAKNLAKKVVREAIALIASAIFLNYLGRSLLNCSTRRLSKEVYDTTVRGPLEEEVIFRFFVARGIYVTQRMLDHFQIKLHLPVELQLFGQAYVHMIYYISKAARSIFTSIPVINRWCIVESKNEKGLSAEETKQAELESISRSHLAAFIFAATHLPNSRNHKLGLLIHSAWAYWGGITYEHLSKKYHSLAPGFIAHGLNNIIAMALPTYQSRALIAALFINRIAFYALSTIK